MDQINFLDRSNAYTRNKQTTKDGCGYPDDDE